MIPRLTLKLTITILLTTLSLSHRFFNSSIMPVIKAKTIRFIRELYVAYLISRNRQLINNRLLSVIFYLMFLTMANPSECASRKPTYIKHFAFLNLSSIACLPLSTKLYYPLHSESTSVIHPTSLSFLRT